MSDQPPQHIVYQPPIQPPIQPSFQPPFQPQTNATAVTSLVLGIIAALIGVWALFPIFGIAAGIVAFLPALLAIILGHVGLRGAKRTGAGRGQALAGLVLGYASIAVIIAGTLFWTWLLFIG